MLIAPSCEGHSCFNPIFCTFWKEVTIHNLTVASEAMLHFFKTQELLLRVGTFLGPVMLHRETDDIYSMEGIVIRTMMIKRSIRYKSHMALESPVGSVFGRYSFRVPLEASEKCDSLPFSGNLGMEMARVQHPG
ncbi:hypothetical protein STEG23_020427 [Scotinomys teguina]